MASAPKHPSTRRPDPAPEDGGPEAAESPAPLPLRLVVVTGLPGSAHSTVARELGARTGWPVLDEEGLCASLPGRGSEAGRRADELLGDRVAWLARQGAHGAILDARSSFVGPRLESLRRALADSRGGLVTVACQCPDSVAEARLAAQGVPLERLEEARRASAALRADLDVSTAEPLGPDAIDALIDAITLTPPARGT